MAATPSAAGPQDKHRKIVNCDRCKNGTYVRRGRMSWQDQHLRCAYCKGTGRVYADPQEKAA